MKKLFSAVLTLSLILGLSAVPASALELEDARRLLRENYMDPIPESVLALDSLEEILEALGDPYTEYLTAEEYEAFLDSINGSTVVGIGVTIQTAFDDGFQITAVQPGSPAQEAGLKAGDRIVAADGRELLSAEEMQNAVRGEEGTSVTLTVVRQADGARRDYVIERRLVGVPIVTYAQEGSVGYIDCTSFGDSTSTAVRQALEALDRHVDVWIMDLRRNPGGSERSVAGTAGYFTGGGLTMIYYRGGDGRYSFTGVSAQCPDLTDKPLIVLTSAYSASASELFAGAARDYRVGIGVGQRTFGKGVAQAVLDKKSYPDLFDGDALKLTVYRFFAPDGATNQNLGVLPTLLISPENTQTAAELLTCSPSDDQGKRLKLELGGFTFYVNAADALREANRGAFAELLEALPPSTEIVYNTGTGWDQASVFSPQDLAKKMGVPFHSRYGFTDLEGVPQADKIRTLAVYGLIGGDEDGAFRPNDGVTRAQFAVMLAAALSLPAGERTRAFSDVDPDAWYAGAAAALYNRGLISGKGDGAFHPEDAVTYDEAVAILGAAAGWIDMDAYELLQNSVPIGEAETYYYLPLWAQVPARTLNKLGAELDLSQTGGPATRAQAAGLIFDMMDACGLFWGI